MSTTDTIPSAADQAVSKSRLAWASSQDSIRDAQEQLEAWVTRNGFDAVVGVRMIAYPGIRVTDWVIYGTAVSWVR